MAELRSRHADGGLTGTITTVRFRTRSWFCR